MAEDEELSNIDPNVDSFHKPPLVFPDEIPKTRGFKMASLNVVSLTRHIDEIRIWSQQQNLDLLAINETRLDPFITSEQINLPGYVVLRKDRNRYGGGHMYIPT